MQPSLRIRAEPLAPQHSVVDLRDRRRTLALACGFVATDSLNQCEQCRRPLVLFGLERDQLRLVCGVCAAMRTGLPDPGCFSRGDRLTPAQTAIKIYLEQIPCQVMAREKNRCTFGVRFQLRPALFFCCISLIPAADASQR
jgi:hypothetical protein